MGGEVPSDRVRSGVKPLGDQFATELRDQLGGLAQGHDSVGFRHHLRGTLGARWSYTTCRRPRW
jgi:hypothetical protein